MDEYTAFARVYDEFMDNIDYEAWCSFIVKILSRHNINDGFILDLGCGTGTLTELLAKAGYKLTGIDASAEMLQKAVEKRDESGADILYSCQDMTDFELHKTMNAIVSTCDCINYIIEKEELLRVFKSVYAYLAEGGVFVFDFNTRLKYENIGEACIAESRDDAAFIWENYYDKEEKINEYQLTVFIETQKDVFRRYEECHIQRGCELDEIQELLSAAGLKILNTYDGYEKKEISDMSERIVVAAKRGE